MHCDEIPTDAVDVSDPRDRRGPRPRPARTRPGSGLVVAAVVALVASTAPAAPAGAAALPAGACRYVTAISSPDGVTPAGIDEISVPGSDAAAYAVFQNDMRTALRLHDRTVERTVRCGRSSVAVDLYQYGLPIKPPKRVTTVYRRFTTAPDGRVQTFRVNGAPIAGRVLAGGPSTSALGTAVTLSSAYRVPRSGGEAFRTANSLLVAVTATAPPDAGRDLATGATVYRTARDEYLAMNTIGQGSPLQPGASGTWVMQFDARRFGGTLVIPVVAGSSSGPASDTPLEAARLLVAPG